MVHRLECLPGQSEHSPEERERLVRLIRLFAELPEPPDPFGLYSRYAELKDRFLASIQMERQDFNGKVLTVRRDDLRQLSRILGEDEEFANRIDEVRISLRP